MKKTAFLLLVILALPKVGAALLIDTVHGGDVALIALFSGEPYCNVQRGCSPSGFPVYVFYDGERFTRAPPWFGSYYPVGYLNGSWLLDKLDGRYELVAYDGKTARSLFSREIDGYQPTKAVVVGNHLYVYVEDFPNKTSIYRVSLDGTAGLLGEVKNEFDAIAFRDYLFIRTSPPKTLVCCYYDYYVHVNESFRWLAGGLR